MSLDDGFSEAGTSVPGAPTTTSAATAQPLQGASGETGRRTKSNLPSWMTSDDDGAAGGVKRKREGERVPRSEEKVLPTENISS